MDEVGFFRFPDEEIRTQTFLFQTFFQRFSPAVRRFD